MYRLFRRLYQRLYWLLRYLLWWLFWQLLGQLFWWMLRLYRSPLSFFFKRWGLIVISLKNIRDRVQATEQYITTAQANNYIANSGTVSATNNLAGLPLSHYNCNGGCSWSCSGGCSYGAGNR